MAVSAIVKSYVNLIKAGKKTIEDVPVSIREQVKEVLGLN